MNELTLLQTNGQLPDYLRELKYEDSGLGAGIAPRAPKLGVTTAKQWTITKDGQTMILPPDEKGQYKVRGVFVASGETITKAWYAKAFVPGSTEAPDCYSNDGKIPVAGCKAPQHANCAQCPKNAFGSHPVTGRGKACGDRKLTVFVWEGLPGELLTFNIPTMSMQNLRKYDMELRNANIPIQSVMVELTFDPGILYPVVKIAALGFVDKQNAVHLIEKSRSQEVADLLREVDYEDQPDAPPPAATVPQQTIQLGQAAPETYPPETTQQQQAQTLQTNVNTTLPVDPPKRRRRTKAEMEAARAAEEAAEAAARQQALQPPDLTQAYNPAALQAAQQSLQPENQQAAPPGATGGMDIANLLAKWQQ